ncbi:MAG: hypothetical protein AB1679_04340 [Actinomycetota bacterium]|jgi:hypothetical protein
MRLPPLAAITDSCWSRPARVWLVVVTASAAGLLAVAAIGAGAQDRLDRQLAWLNLAIVASIVSAGAQLLFLLHGWRSVAGLRRVVVDRRRAAREDWVVYEPARPNDLITVPGTPWWHRPSCLLVGDKPTVPAGRGSAQVPCPVCRPQELASA